jgi:hypothetical protein
MIGKAEHTFKEKQRIRFRHLGVEHHGVITGTNARNLLIVRTDSGHTLLVHPSNDEAEPEDFPTHSGVEPAPAKATVTVAQLDGLRRALALGQLDEVDAYHVRDAFAKLSTMVSLDGPETEAERTLTAMCKKHLGASAGGDTFNKAAGASPAFHIGDRIMDKWGCLGKITAINEVRAEIAYDSGIQGTVLLGYFKAA